MAVSSNGGKTNWLLCPTGHLFTPNGKQFVCSARLLAPHWDGGGCCADVQEGIPLLELIREAGMLAKLESRG